MSQIEGPNTHLVETCLYSEQILKGEFIAVNHDTVRLPDGGEVTREYVVNFGAVVVISG